MAPWDAAKEAPRCVVVRYEDMLLRPSAMVEALERAGLRRNGRQFAPIERNVRLGAGEYHGNGGVPIAEGRKALLRRNRASRQTKGLQPWMLQKLSSQVQAEDLAWLGYKLPQVHIVSRQTLGTTYW